MMSKSVLFDIVPFCNPDMQKGIGRRYGRKRYGRKRDKIDCC